VVPGITLRDRLRVLLPSDPNNYYRKPGLVSVEYRGDLGTAKFVMTDFHAFKQGRKVQTAKPIRPSLRLPGRVRGMGVPSRVTISSGDSLRRVW
jgi:type III restriction enzyme